MGELLIMIVYIGLTETLSGFNLAMVNSGGGARQ